MRTFTSEDFRRWGSEGGKKSRRSLTAAQAREMVARREQKKRNARPVDEKSQDDFPDP